jgi:RNA-splicing ligase RtcB
MDPGRFERIDATRWRIAPTGAMRVAAPIVATETLLRDMEDKVAEQLAHVAALPGVADPVLAMPDAHWGHGFPIGGVAAFDAADGVVSAGGVGFDISCGVRPMASALANRQILAHPARRTFAHHVPGARPRPLYDVSHDTCKEEIHRAGGRLRRLLVHRKGATRAFAGDDASLPPAFRGIGQPVLIGGSMGGDSYVLAGPRAGGTPQAAASFASACHGAGRRMSRHAAARRWRGRAVQDALRARGILVLSPSARSIAEEAPDA